MTEGTLKIVRQEAKVKGEKSKVRILNEVFQQLPCRDKGRKKDNYYSS